uniref:Uncharacterized protein n=1 Tax=Zea mays TaxID=4577 RepID=B6U3H5_MAIZE|nr:hypothetical protein [Zea mays]|eukprot:NP_001144931.1 uncharacterized protein LOC100278058 [Zea mays]
MDLDADMIPTSPSADSSPSSSDLDTESTGSFFPDRSTTLGTLMGVSAFGGRRAPAAGEGSAEGPQRAALGHGEEARGAGVWRRRRRWRRRGSWWRLCRDQRWAADVAGRVPGHGAAARGRGLPLRRQRRRRVGARDGRGAVRERKGAASSAARGRRGGGEGQVAAAAGVGWLVDLDGDGVGVPGAPAGAAHRHLQRRSRVNVVNKLQLSRFGEGVFRDKNGVDASLIKPPCPCFFSH